MKSRPVTADMTMKLIKQFTPNPLSGYSPYTLDIFCMQEGFYFDNLYSMRITKAETSHKIIEIEYKNDKVNSIRIYLKSPL